MNEQHIKKPGLRFPSIKTRCIASQQIPKLRFPEFEGEWGKKKLGDTAELTSSKRVYLSDYTSSGIPFFRGKEITELKQGLEPSDILYISESAYLKFKEQYGVPEYDDILMTAVGTLGNVYRITDDKPFYFKDGNLIWFRKIQEHSSFLEILLFVNKKEVEKSSIGSTQRALTMVELRKLCFFLPHLPEQQKIASFFTAIDQKISQLKRKKTLLEQYKKGVMQGIFNSLNYDSNDYHDDYDNQDLKSGLSHKSHKSHKSRLRLRFRNDNGQEFPKWEKRKLGDVGKPYNGLTGKSKDDFGQGKPYIQYKQIFDDSRIDITRFDFVRIRDGEKQCRVRYGDVFFTTSSETPDEVGTSSVLLDEVSEVYLNSFCFGYRSSQDVLIPQFSRYLFRNELLRKEINKLAQGSTRYNISKNELMKTVIELPTIQEQTKIANFLSAIDDKISHTQKQIEKAEVWKKGLMQQMFV